MYPSFAETFDLSGSLKRTFNCCQDNRKCKGERQSIGLGQWCRHKFLFVSPTRGVEIEMYSTRIVACFFRMGFADILDISVCNLRIFSRRGMTAFGFSFRNDFNGRHTVPRSLLPEVWAIIGLMHQHRLTFSIWFLLINEVGCPSSSRTAANHSFVDCECIIIKSSRIKCNKINLFRSNQYSLKLVFNIYTQMYISFCDSKIATEKS